MTNTLTLGALGVKDVIAAILADTLTAPAYFISIEGYWTWRGITAGNGPIQFGWSHSDYTAAEIEEQIEATGGLAMGDMISREQAKRKVRVAGVIDDRDGDGEEAIYRKVKTPLRFTAAAAQSLNMWARNLAGAALDTGSTLQFEGTVFLRDF